jgi:hypothetical protein
LVCGPKIVILYTKDFHGSILNIPTLPEIFQDYLEDINFNRVNHGNR